MTKKHDDSTYAREDSLLAELIPQVTEHLAAQQADDFDADAGKARFETWLAQHTEEPRGPATAPDRADNAEPRGTGRRGRRGLGFLISRHPRAAAFGLAAAAVGTSAILRAARWTRGTARVRELVIRRGGWIVVEMSDGAVFIADHESLRRLQGAQQSTVPVPYWIDNFKMIYGIPRGGIGGIGDTALVEQFT